jgi:hypothetical protein
LYLDGTRHIAEQSNIETELVEKRRRKVSRRLDSGDNEAVLSAIDELKREITNLASSELKTRFVDHAGLYELVGWCTNVAKC